MDEQSEVIHHQMEETRHRLAEKLDQLGKQTAGTVEAVTESVGTVQETVTSVADNVQETVKTVQKAFDLPGHVQRNPWLALGGAVIAGYAVGCLLAPRARRDPRWDPGMAAGMASSSAPPGEAERASKSWSGEQPDSLAAGMASSSASPGQGQTSEEPRQSSESGDEESSSWFGGILEQFMPDINSLKGLAIGAVLGVAREVVTRGLPHDLTSKLTGVFDDFTTKLGGQPVSMASEGGEKSESREHTHGEKRNGSGAGRATAAAPGTVPS